MTADLKALAAEVATGERILREHPGQWYDAAAHLAKVRAILDRLAEASGGLETTEEVIGEIKRRLAKAGPGPWHSDCERNSGLYGSGEDVEEGYDSSYILDAQNRRVVDTSNSDGTVEVEYDEDGTHAWDEAGRQNVELIVLLRNEGDRLLRDRTRLLARVVAGEEAKERFEQAGRAILRDPHGCRFCDSGKLRTPGVPEKDHDPECGFALLRAALTEGA